MVWRRILGVLVLAGAVGAAAWVVFASSLLAVADVSVEGERSLSARRIIREAAVPVGEPLARVDLDAVADRVEQLPPVRQVEVQRAWPDTVVLLVEERTPVAVLVSGGEHHLVDRDGVRLRAVPGPRKALPTIEAADQQAAAEAAEVVAGLPDDIERRVASLEASTMDSIRMRLKSGREVEWGSAEESETKAEVLAALLQQEGSVVDVRVPSAPTVRRP
jgi:cell division protein FtsQ